MSLPADDMGSYPMHRIVMGSSFSLMVMRPSLSVSPSIMPELPITVAPIIGLLSAESITTYCLAGAGSVTANIVMAKRSFMEMGRPFSKVCAKILLFCAMVVYDASNYRGVVRKCR